MKRIANYLIALAVAAFTFTSCSDVPSPFGDIVKPASGDVVVIEPSGTGTEADPYNVAAVLEYISGLGADTPSPKEVYIKGYAVELTDISAQYGNATFTMSDNADGTANKFTVYRAAGLGNQKVTDESFIKQGDMVVVCGKVTNYKGNTPETVQGAAYVYSVNGNKGGGTTPATTLGTKDAPLTVAQALETIKALADNGTTEQDAYVTGKITKIKTADADISKYKNIDYIISDGTNELTVFRGKNVDNTDFTEAGQINVGDEVVVLGKLTKYVKDGNTTPEVAQGNYIVKLTKGSGSDSNLGTKDAPLTVAKALEIINALADGGETADAYVKGTISQVTSYNSTYKSITYYISDDGKTTNELQVYSGKGLNGAEFAAKEDLSVGDQVVIKGKLKKYVKNGNVTPEINQSSEIVTIVKASGGGNDLGTKDAPLTVVKALEIINALADGGETADAYVKGTISQVTSYNSTYKSITYYISDDGKTTNELQVYSGKGLNGAEFAAKEDLSVGDQVVIKGKLKKYVKNGKVTPEINQSSEIVTITKASGGDNTGGGELTAAFADLDCSNIASIKLSDGTTLSVAQEDGKSAPIYHENTKIIRIYARNSITVDAGSKKIAKVEFAYDTYNGTAYKGNDEMYGEVGSDKIKPSKDEKNVTFNNVNSSKIKLVNWLESGTSGGTQLRITGLTITYAK